MGTSIQHEPRSSPRLGLVTGGVNGTVMLWDVDFHQERMTLKGYSEEVTSITFSADGPSLATSVHDSVVRLWRTAPAQ
jgi:WD40 repeat protein